ncbi:MAG: UDP-3-O-(3-hydroxymyristoyl)glucosamine N-acyltransferase, partial [Rhodospirillales bacterium]|nr:UDP-3-O-(3-hydroxymyristoyl)glucosamine N-acyltransferase [Rhodospirillales bacterium]
DPRFFSRAGPFSLRELANIAEAELLTDSAEATPVTDVAPLSQATSEDISFLDNKLYVAEFTASAAGACIIRPDYKDKAPPGMALLLTTQPYHAYARVAAAFYPVHTQNPSTHPSAQIDSSATVGSGVKIGPNVVVSDGVEIGDGTEIGANTTICSGVKIGENCRVFPNVTLQCCLIGDRVILHPGVRIGQDGFGFAMAATGHLKVPQLGRVMIEDDVEIGANSTIDRGTGPDTIIAHGCKIDNLVQIGHNAQLGSDCIIVAQTGISGSTQLGNFVAMGGQVGIAGHLTIGDGVQIAAQSGVMRSVNPGEKIGGSPAQPMSEWMRSISMIHRAGKKKGLSNG